MKTADSWIHDYFADHLGSRMHRELLPGLSSLSTDFTIEVGEAGAWELSIEGGVIEVCERATVPSPECHVAIGPADFADLVAGEVTPQSLFIRRRLKIRGNPLKALKAASAMVEFFERFPYHAPART